MSHGELRQTMTLKLSPAVRFILLCDSAEARGSVYVSNPFLGGCVYVSHRPVLNEAPQVLYSSAQSGPLCIRSSAIDHVKIYLFPLKSPASFSGLCRCRDRSLLTSPSSPLWSFMASVGPEPRSKAYDSPLRADSSALSPLLTHWPRAPSVSCFYLP